jgi:hypothetical protein
LSSLCPTEERMLKESADKRRPALLKGFKDHFREVFIRAVAPSSIALVDRALGLDRYDLALQSLKELVNELEACRMKED